MLTFISPERSTGNRTFAGASEERILSAESVPNQTICATPKQKFFQSSPSCKAVGVLSS